MADSHPDSGTTRRGLLGSLIGGLGLAAAAPLREAQSAPRRSAVTWSLTAVPTTYNFPIGTVLPFYRLQHVGPGTTHGLIPVVEAVEGQTVTLQIHNQLPIPIRPALVGVADGPILRPGQTLQFTFTMPSAGSYLIGESTGQFPGAGGLTRADRKRPASGFSAMVISRPASGGNVLWSGGPAYDREYFLLYEDADDRWNATMGSATSMVPAEGYEPNFFMVNGQSYPDIASDPSALIVGNVGERILIRLGNLGRMRQSLHFHGYHPEVVARNNVIETIFGEKDTVPVPPRTTTDVILTPNQVGDYPLHPHSLTAVTANGFYPMGQLTLISIT